MPVWKGSSALPAAPFRLVPARDGRDIHDGDRHLFRCTTSARLQSIPRGSFRRSGTWPPYRILPLVDFRESPVPQAATSSPSLMLSSAIEALYRTLLTSYPSNHAYKTADFDEATMPAPVAHFLRKLLEQRIDAEMEAISDLPADWVDVDSPVIKKALLRLDGALRDHAKVPPELWEDALGHSVEQVVSFLVRPARTAADFVFDDEENERSRQAILRRLSYYSAYPYLTEVLLGYFDRKSIEALPRNEFAAILNRIERQLGTESNPDDWVKLMQPLFDVLGFVPEYRERGVPISLVRTFLEAKGATSYVDAIDAARSQSGLDRVRISDIRPIFERNFSPGIESETPPSAAENVADPIVDADWEEVDTEEDHPPVEHGFDGAYVEASISERVEEPDQEEEQAVEDVPDVEEPDDFQHPAPAESAKEAAMRAERPPAASHDLFAESDDEVDDTEPDTSTPAAQPEPAVEAPKTRDQVSGTRKAPASKERSAKASPAVKAEGKPDETRATATPMARSDSPARAAAEPEPLWKRFHSDSSPAPHRQAAPQAGEEVPLWMRFRKTEAPAKPSGEAGESTTTRSQDLADLEHFVLGAAAEERATFVRQLFNGSEDGYADVLQHLSRASDWAEASQIIGRRVFQANKVNIYGDPAIAFTEAVERRFRK
jgi:hypothetical protein